MNAPEPLPLVDTTVGDALNARSVLEMLCRDESTRRGILGALAESIRFAHEANPSGWNLTLAANGKYLRLNAGPIFVFDVQREWIAITAIEALIPEDLRRRVDDASYRIESDGFRALPEARWYSFPPDELSTLWDQVKEGHREAVRRAASATRRTPFFPYHNSGAIEYLETFLDQELPEPNYHFTRDELNQLLDRIRSIYPDWDSFRHPGFVKDEIGYKREAAELAAGILGENEFRQLLQQGNFDEIIARLKRIASGTNLLFLGVPGKGDLGIVYREDLDRAAFSRQLHDLLYGEGFAPERLNRYLQWVRENDLPSKWTFPTYFLFLLHPEQEVFVKPSVTNRFMKQLSLDVRFSGEPDASSYALIREVCHRLRDDLSQEYGARDMIDIQGFTYVIKRASDTDGIPQDRRGRFEALYNKFLDAYVNTSGGIRHAQAYSTIRTEARRNFDDILAAQEGNEEVTDRVLLKLLPYADTDSNRAKGAWVHLAPAINGDIRKWFAARGLGHANDWPHIADSILRFVVRCIQTPSDLEIACKQFDEAPHTRGFQTGMMTPILNALRPNDFTLVNNKSRQTINYLARRRYRQSLRDYPVANRTAFEILEELESTLQDDRAPDLIPGDLLDMFSHWVVSLSDEEIDPKTQYWKIAPGEGAWQWDECRDGNFIGVGWEEFGDISQLDREGFNALRDKLLIKHKDWTKSGTGQVWKFAHQIKEGDRIVVNRGTTEILGTGTVSGPYYFLPETRHGHRRPIQWDDLVPRKRPKGEEKGWQRTIVKLDHDKFAEVHAWPSGTESVRGDGKGRPRTDDGYFTERTFELLGQLHEKPKKTFYLDHKEEFLKHVEEPFQRLLTDVVRQLPSAITDVMETERNLYSRIQKNDWGRGGAWDFYWGAIYPRDGKRISDAQLFIWINHERLDYGFYIGEYGSEAKDRFLRNVRVHRDALPSLLDGGLNDDRLSFGERPEFVGQDRDPEEVNSRPDWMNWLREPQKYGMWVGAHLSTFEALRSPPEEMVKGIVRIFEQLFPLVLLSISEIPLPPIQKYLGEGVELYPPKVEFPLEEFASESGFLLSDLQRWVRAIERKGQAILYGPPGTSKTFAAERLAKHLVGGGRGIVDLVQFHPSYAYEDFIQGIRPLTTAEGDLTYDTMRGRLLEFCREAEEAGDKSVLIIDEINRANLSRVFGELMYLLEYRNKAIPLSGGGRFRIPSNVRIIGTMNTADRSIALVDHALRRRFAFLKLRPNYAVLRHFHKQMVTGFPVENLILILDKLNRDIADEHYEVGITFFLREDLESQLEDIWRMEIEPYLEEYFFNQKEKIIQHSWDKVGSTIVGG